MHMRPGMQGQRPGRDESGSWLSFGAARRVGDDDDVPPAEPARRPGNAQAGTFLLLRLGSQVPADSESANPRNGSAAVGLRDGRLEQPGAAGRRD